MVQLESNIMTSLWSRIQTKNYVKSWLVPCFLFYFYYKNIIFKDGSNMFLVHVKKLDHFSHDKFSFFFNFIPWKIFYSFLIFINLYFFNFNHFKIIFFYLYLQSLCLHESKFKKPQTYSTKHEFTRIKIKKINLGYQK